MRLLVIVLFLISISACSKKGIMDENSLGAVIEEKDDLLVFQIPDYVTLDALQCDYIVIFGEEAHNHYVLQGTDVCHFFVLPLKEVKERNIAFQKIMVWHLGTLFEAAFKVDFSPPDKFEITLFTKEKSITTSFVY